MGKQRREFRGVGYYLEKQRERRKIGTHRIQKLEGNFAKMGLGKSVGLLREASSQTGKGQHSNTKFDCVL